MGAGRGAAAAAAAAAAVSGLCRPSLPFACVLMQPRPTHAGCRCVPQRAQWPPNSHTPFCLFIRGRGVKSNGMGKNKKRAGGGDETRRGEGGRTDFHACFFIDLILFLHVKESEPAREREREREI